MTQQNNEEMDDLLSDMKKCVGEINKKIRKIKKLMIAGRAGENNHSLRLEALFNTCNKAMDSLNVLFEQNNCKSNYTAQEICQSLSYSKTAIADLIIAQNRCN
jgi:hypothetical protein